MKKYSLWIQIQLIERGIKDENILNSFEKIKRENFLPEKIKEFAYQDNALPIDYNQTISQPYIVALMTKLLKPKKTDLILEIGTGSGYQSAILSNLVKSITSIEIIPELANFAKNNLQKNNIKNVEVLTTDGSTYQKTNHYDKIIITAATKIIPKNWIDSLKENGLLVIPQETQFNHQELLTYKKIKNKLELINESIPVVFVPLTGKNS